MKKRHHYLPIEQALPGMVISAPMQISQQGFLSMTLPAGLVLTQENINQLIAHRAEFVDVDLDDPGSDEQVADDAAHAAHRLLEIFEGADLSEPYMANFFDQVLIYRST